MVAFVSNERVTTRDEPSQQEIVCLLNPIMLLYSYRIILYNNIFLIKFHVYLYGISSIFLINSSWFLYSTYATDNERIIL